MAHSRAQPTILVVDDDEVVLHFACMVLTKAGLRVVATGSSSEALRICQDDPSSIQALLLDITMPGLTGPELVQALERAGVSYPVVYMSGYMDASALRPGGPQGQPTFLAKPFTPQRLLHTVQQQLERSGFQRVGERD